MLRLVFLITAPFLAASRRIRTLDGHLGNAEQYKEPNASQQWLSFLEAPPQEAIDATTSVFSRAAELVDKLEKDGKLSKVPSELDVVCAGAAAYSGYFLGAVSVLLELQRRGFTELRRFAGSSAGGQNAMEIILADDEKEPFNSLFSYAHLQEMQGSMYGKAVRTGQALAYDHWKILGDWLVRKHADRIPLLNDRAYLSLTHMRIGIPRNLMVHHYVSPSQASAAFQATGASPLPIKYEGVWAADGLFSNRLPIFVDGQRKQVVVDLAKVLASYRLSLVNVMWNDVASMQKMMSEGQDEMLKVFGESSSFWSVQPIVIQDEDP